MRESPALDMLELLSKRGAELSFSDPFVPALKHAEQTLTSVELSAALATKPDCLVICTDHTAFDYQSIVRSGALVVDTRNALGSQCSSTIFAL